MTRAAPRGAAAGAQEGLAGGADLGAVGKVAGARPVAEVTPFLDFSPGSSLPPSPRERIAAQITPSGPPVGLAGVSAVAAKPAICRVAPSPLLERLSAFMPHLRRAAAEATPAVSIEANDGEAPPSEGEYIEMSLGLGVFERAEESEALERLALPGDAAGAAPALVAIIASSDDGYSDGSSDDDACKSDDKGDDGPRDQIACQEAGRT